MMSFLLMLPPSSSQFASNGADLLRQQHIAAEKARAAGMEMDESIRTLRERFRPAPPPGPFDRPSTAPPQYRHPPETVRVERHEPGVPGGGLEAGRSSIFSRASTWRVHGKPAAMEPPVTAHDIERIHGRLAPGVELPRR